MDGLRASARIPWLSVAFVTWAVLTPQPRAAAEEPAGDERKDAPAIEGGSPIAEDAPVLWIEDPVFDWGKAYQGEQLEHTFVIENRGKAPLDIDAIRPVCGCTFARDADRKKGIQPGEKSSITLHVDTTTLSGPSKKDTEIISNAAGDNRLWMQGEVIELLKMEPALPKVEVIRKSLVPPEPIVISFSPTVEKPFKARSVKALKGNLEPSLVAVEPGKKYTVTLKPTLRDTDESAFQSEVLEILVEIDGREIPLRTTIAILLKDRIDVLPARSVYFHKKDTDKMGRADSPELKRSIELKSIGGPGHRFTIKGAKAKGDAFRVSIQTLEEGRSYRLDAVLVKGPEKDKRFLRDTIEVETDDPEVPLISIPAVAQF